MTKSDSRKRRTSRVGVDRGIDSDLTQAVKTFEVLHRVGDGTTHDFSLLLNLLARKCISYGGYSSNLASGGVEEGARGSSLGGLVGAWGEGPKGGGVNARDLGGFGAGFGVVRKDVG